MNKVLTVVRTLFGTAAKKYPWFFVLQLFAMLARVAIPFAAILISPLIIDEICGARDPGRLWRLALTLIGSECALGLTHQALQTQLQKYQERLKNYFSMQISRHSMHLDFQLTEDKEALDQLDRAQTGMDWYSGGVYGVSEDVFRFLGNLVSIAGYAVLIAGYAPWLLVVVAASVVAGSFVTARIHKIDLEAFQRLSKINRLFGYFGWEIVDFRFGKDIRLYDAAGMLQSRWHDNAEVSGRAWKWQGDASFRYRGLSVAVQLVMSLALYLYAGMLAMAGRVTLGVFTQLIESSGALSGALTGLVGNVQELVKKCGYAYEYVRFMEYPEALEKRHEPVPQGRHRIEFEHVSFRYPNTDRLVLDDVSITIEPGEKLSVVGLNGAGKTTFIKLLCRLYDPTSGRILMDGRDIRDYDYDDYMRQFAPVFQDFKLFGFTIAENVLFRDGDERTGEDTKKTAALLDTVGLGDMVKKQPRGMDAAVYKFFDENGVEPSGGEQQKLAIARALAKDAPVIILDEPTAALDPVAEYEVYRQFHSLVGDKTAFYISHRLSSCQFCDRIAVFSQGSIAEYGTHDTLLGIPGGIYAGMFEAQAQYYR